jgi:Uma2 family endonuclease
MTVQIRRKKFTVAQYQQMIKAGVLTDRDRVELLQGEVIEMSPVGRHHASCVDRLTEFFVLRLSAGAMVRVQSPIQLGLHSEPQPDLTLLKRRNDFYADAHPQPQDIFAIIEVSDTTIEFDRTIKIPLYVENAITEVWIVDLNEQCIEVYREPNALGYQQVQVFRRGQSLSLQAFPQVQFSVDQLLG